jgi:hypothetical protein
LNGTNSRELYALWFLFPLSLKSWVSRAVVSADHFHWSELNLHFDSERYWRKWECWFISKTHYVIRSLTRIDSWYLILSSPQFQPMTGDASMGEDELRNKFLRLDDKPANDGIWDSNLSRSLV